MIGDAADDVVQAVQGISTTLSTDLQIARFRGLVFLIGLVGDITVMIRPIRVFASLRISRCA